VNAVIGLAHALHMTVVAEGVETVAQYQRLASLDYDACQGFLFARPMSETSFDELLASTMAAGPKPAWRTGAADAAADRIRGHPANGTVPAIVES